MPCVLSLNNNVEMAALSPSTGSVDLLKSVSLDEADPSASAAVAGICDDAVGWTYPESSIPIKDRTQKAFRILPGTSTEFSAPTDHSFPGQSALESQRAETL